MDSTNLTIDYLYGILINFTLFYQILPYFGEIDHDNKVIIINPIFEMDDEILMHELLHYLYPETTEWYIRELAKEIVEQDDEIKLFLFNYCRNYAQIMGGRNFFSKIGI